MVGLNSLRITALPSSVGFRVVAIIPWEVIESGDSISGVEGLHGVIMSGCD